MVAADTKYAGKRYSLCDRGISIWNIIIEPDPEPKSESGLDV